MIPSALDQVDMLDGEQDLPEDELSAIRTFVDSSQRYAKHTVEEAKLGDINSDDIFRQMDIKKQEIQQRKRIEEELKAKLMDEEADKEKAISKFVIEESKGGSAIEDIDIILKDIKIEDISPSSIISTPSLSKLDSKVSTGQ
jgi:hypothetical protein